jgi:hypothetical protein
MRLYVADTRSYHSQIRGALGYPQDATSAGATEVQPDKQEDFLTRLAAFARGARVYRRVRRVPAGGVGKGGWAVRAVWGTR